MFHYFNTSLSINRYSYCLFSPLQYVDPSGLLIDEWEINRFGKIVNHIVTDKHDAFFIVDDEGNRIEGKELIFPYGTIERFNSQYSDQSKTTFDWYDIRGDENGTQLFEFLATNTSVEWGQLQMGQKGDNGLNVVTTSHSSDKESCGFFLVKNKYQYGYTIRMRNHSHPRNIAYPSGLDENSGDIGFAKWIEKFSPNISLNIYLPANNKYIHYNSKSNSNDFPNYPSILLPTITIRAKKY